MELEECAASRRRRSTQQRAQQHTEPEAEAAEAEAEVEAEVEARRRRQQRYLALECSSTQARKTQEARRTRQDEGRARTLRCTETLVSRHHLSFSLSLRAARALNTAHRERRTIDFASGFPRGAPDADTARPSHLRRAAPRLLLGERSAHPQQLHDSYLMSIDVRRVL